MNSAESNDETSKEMAAIRHANTEFVCQQRIEQSATNLDVHIFLMDQKYPIKKRQQNSGNSPNSDLKTNKFILAQAIWFKHLKNLILCGLYGSSSTSSSLQEAWECSAQHLVLFQAEVSPESWSHSFSLKVVVFNLCSLSSDSH